MVMLTEEMVIVRTKQSNLEAITKLNFWGSQISNISIVRKLPNVKVLSLSVNNINTLIDFQYCKQLEVLFVRNNKINDINEVCYLKDLKYLKNLWLDENPCANNSETYRMSVIKTLPQLEKLDDVIIENSEVLRAQNYGKSLYRPDQCEQKIPSPEVPVVEQQRNNYSPEPPQRNNYSPEPQIQYQREREYNQQNSYESEQNVYNEVKVNDHHGPVAEPPEVPVRAYKYEEKVPVTKMPRPIQYASIPRSRTTDGEFTCDNDCWKRREYQGSTCCVQLTQKRPNERRTNVLNAVLCLIKELDYPNLEVVQMAVNCRMDELSDET